MELDPRVESEVWLSTVAGRTTNRRRFDLFHKNRVIIFIGNNPSTGGSKSQADGTIKRIEGFLLGAPDFTVDRRIVDPDAIDRIIIVNLYSKIDPTMSKFDFSDILARDDALAETKRVLDKYPEAPVICAWGIEDNADRKTAINALRSVLKSRPLLLRLQSDTYDDGSEPDFKARSWSPRSLSSYDSIKKPYTLSPFTMGLRQQQETASKESQD